MGDEIFKEKIPGSAIEYTFTRLTAALLVSQMGQVPIKTTTAFN